MSFEPLLIGFCSITYIMMIWFPVANFALLILQNCAGCWESAEGKEWSGSKPREASTRTWKAEGLSKTQVCLICVACKVHGFAREPSNGRFEDFHWVLQAKSLLSYAWLYSPAYMIETQVLFKHLKCPSSKTLQKGRAHQSVAIVNLTQASLRTSEAQVNTTKALLRESEQSVKSRKQDNESYQVKLKAREEEAKTSSRKVRLAAS